MPGAGPRIRAKQLKKPECLKSVKTLKTAKPLKRRNDGVRVAPLYRRLKR